MGSLDSLDSLFDDMDNLDNINHLNHLNHKIQMLEKIKMMKIEIEKLRAENDTLKSMSTNIKPVTFKVSDRGAISVEGLNCRYPIVLYKQQWERLMDKKEDLAQFITENDNRLATLEMFF